MVGELCPGSPVMSFPHRPWQRAQVGGHVHPVQPLTARAWALWHPLFFCTPGLLAGSSLRILLLENTTVKQMPGKTVSRPFHACSMYRYKWNEFPDCWSVCGFVLTLLPLVWIKQILFLLLAWTYCHQTAWLSTALALARLQTVLSLPLADAVLFAGRATASSFVYLVFLAGGGSVSLLSKHKGELWGCCLLGLFLPAGFPVTCHCSWADPFNLPVYRAVWRGGFGGCVSVEALSECQLVSAAMKGTIWESTLFIGMLKILRVMPFCSWMCPLSPTCELPEVARACPCLFGVDVMCSSSWGCCLTHPSAGHAASGIKAGIRPLLFCFCMAWEWPSGDISPCLFCSHVLIPY